MSKRAKLRQIAQAQELFPELSVAQKEANRLMVEIASRIFGRRKELGKTQAQMADLLGVKQPMVSQWEQGECNFTIESLTHIFSQLNLRIELSFTPLNCCFPVFYPPDKAAPGTESKSDPRETSLLEAA